MSKQFAPSVQRNREDILGVLRDVLPEQGLVLEVASGSGEHAVYFAQGLPGVTWQPSDRDPQALASIRAWSEEAGLQNLRNPIELDVVGEDWGIERADAIVAINMVHISPWAACEGLITGAGRVLPPEGTLFLYGAYFRADRDTAPSNLEFDRSLRERDPRWGVRQLEKVVDTAAAAGLDLCSLVDMPNNNYSVVFRRV